MRSCLRKGEPGFGVRGLKVLAMNEPFACSCCVFGVGVFSFAPLISPHCHDHGRSYVERSEQMAWFTQSRQASEAISQMIEYKLREEPAFLYLAIARCPVCTCMCGVVWCVVYTVCCDVR